MTNSQTEQPSHGCTSLRDSGRGQAGPGGGGLDACRCRAITLNAAADSSLAQAPGSGGGNAMLQRPEHVALRRPSLHFFTRAVRRRCQVTPASDLTTAVYGTTFRKRWPTACSRGKVDRWWARQARQRRRQ